MLTETQVLDKAGTDMICDFLIDAINHVIRLRAEEQKDNKCAQLHPEDQHAVRVLGAAQRRVQNTYDAVNHPDPQMRLRAVLALQLNDNGDVFTFAEVRHSRGRLDCSGCDFVYVSATGTLAKEQACVICQFCKKGVAHVRTVYGPYTYEDKLGEVNLVAGECAKWSQCDECGSRAIVPVKEGQA